MSKPTTPKQRKPKKPLVKPRGRPPRNERDFAAIRSAEDNALRQRILAAAADVFAERGFASASIDEVARQLGATKGLVYHRYRSKGELLADLCAEGLEALNAQLEAIADRPMPAISRLTDAATSHASDVVNRIGLHRTLAEAFSGRAAALLPASEQQAIAAFAAQRKGYEAIFTRLIVEATQQHDLPGGRDTAMITRIFISTLDAPLRWPTDMLDQLAEKSQLIARQLSYFAMRGAGASDTTLTQEFSR
ncbi:TetR/AcrR family transcriptional regulator [Jiella sp. MQZ9-1]|uniref:TetR/AcrR family transcriptional regulator n=1 Tax=Jiella flava TaxID=2816857 RepID=A0A939FZ81_9HYPH|nr:TetR/AcrR family transcriptional regulator [Jiella flava]MBO0662069.1 TetR/AcrR family transcriptional regulator [Jiella flava]MCD2470603.1 TetR/AcrR family transcriptional regulator [Jiella flava]